MDKSVISKINESTLNRYSDRFKKLGHNVQSLGWGTEEQQQSRFRVLADSVDFSSRHVLDIGCGFADLYDYFHANSIPITSYTGWDINRQFIDVAKAKHTSIANQLLVHNILTDDDIRPTADVSVMLGLLNYNYQSATDNTAFTQSMIQRAFQSAKECLYVDFISSYIDLSYPKEDFIFYHDPSFVLSYCLTLTSNVTLHHDYPVMPQKEFSVILYK